MLVTLADLVRWLAPALDCDIVVQDDFTSNRVEACLDNPIARIVGNTWKDCDPSDLIRNLIGIDHDPGGFKHWAVTVEQLSAAMRTIEHDHRIIARASLFPEPYATVGSETVYLQGAMVSGGLRVSDTNGIVGIFEGAPSTAVRDEGKILATDRELSDWATEQAAIWEPWLNESGRGFEPSLSHLIRMNADMVGIYICYTRGGRLSRSELVEWVRGRDEIVALNDDVIDIWPDSDGLIFWDTFGHRRIEPSDSLVIIPDSGAPRGWSIWGDGNPDKRWAPSFADESQDSRTSPQRWWYLNQRGVAGFVFKCVVEGWGCDFDAALDGLTFIEEPDEDYPVGNYENGEIFAADEISWIARRPG